MAEEFVKEITPKGIDFSSWYVDVVRKAELMDYAPVKGFMALRPYGYEIWERIQEGLDRRFKATGHRNAYFPLLIPESLLVKEAEHVEGFAPEVAWVTHGGNEPLGERLAIRPTSEAIIGSFYSKWIKSYRDLPVLLNQWCSVVRWERATRPFIRTSEFLWQEGHTVHRTAEEAEEETRRMLEVYRDFVENDLAIPVIPGRKTESEKFAGAEYTLSIEALMTDGRALQAGTSHFLGQHFAKVFDIQFLDDDGQLKYGYQTSWGVSTRLIGALIMVHGDDRGLVLPPRVAPIQVVIIPVGPQKKREMVVAQARKLHEELSGVARVHLDDREEYTPGWKYNDWEMRGVPLRMEIGPRDIEQDQVILVRRDSGEKWSVARADIAGQLSEVLGRVQEGIRNKALAFLRSNTHTVSSYEEFKTIMAERRGLLVAGWCGDAACEAKIKEETGATARCIPLDEAAGEGTCLLCGRESRHRVYFARAY
ncbi:MAG: proline--tRNA ligase [Bacillota bacterium]